MYASFSCRFVGMVKALQSSKCDTGVRVGAAVVSELDVLDEEVYSPKQADLDERITNLSITKNEIQINILNQ